MSLQCPKCSSKCFNDNHLKMHMRSNHRPTPEECKTLTEWANECVLANPGARGAPAECALTLEQIKKLCEQEESAKQFDLELALSFYSQRGNIPIAQYLLEEKKVNINCQLWEWGAYTPLECSMVAGEDIARYLFSKGAQVPEKSHLVLTASLYGHIELIKLMLIAGVPYKDPENETIIEAVEKRGEEKNKAEVLKFLREEAPKLIRTKKEEKKRRHRQQQQQQLQQPVRQHLLARQVFLVTLCCLINGMINQQSYVSRKL